jgi:hypothetical protein
LTLTTVAEAFEDYRTHVLPQGAPPIQIEETRRAFYAATYLTLMHLMNDIGSEATSEEEGVAHLEALKAECEGFAAAQRDYVAAQLVEPQGYNVRSKDVEAALRELASLIKPQVPTGYGFTLLIFSYGAMGLKGEGKAGAMFYISSAQRDDMIKAMKEFIAHQTH